VSAGAEPQLSPEYSICITDYNNASTARKTLDSIVNQIDGTFEVVVVDSVSSDGTREILREYSERQIIKLTEVKCTRGRGRQKAFESSSGKYVISNVDLDNPLKPNLIQLMCTYHQVCDGSLLFALSPTVKNAWGPAGISIIPRALVQRLGGWRNVQIFEDTDLFARASQLGMYRWGWFDILQSANDRSDWPWVKRLRYRYATHRDWLRLGGKLKFGGGSPWGSALKLLAAIDSEFRTKYPNAYLETYKSMDSHYRVDLGADEP